MMKDKEQQIVLEFVSVSKELVALIESASGMSAHDFVLKARQMLPMLYLKASMLPKLDSQTEGDMEQYVTPEHYEYVKLSLKEKLGDYDATNKTRHRLSDFTLLDELDKAVVGKSDWPAKTAEEFIRETISLGKGLIVASNLTQKGLAEQFGESLVSALQRNLLLVPVEGEDYSTKLQSELKQSWEQRLSGEVDYYADSIVQRARNREDFRVNVERESWSPYFVY